MYCPLDDELWSWLAGRRGTQSNSFRSGIFGSEKQFKVTNSLLLCCSQQVKTRVDDHDDKKLCFPQELGIRIYRRRDMNTDFGRALDRYSERKGDHVRVRENFELFLSSRYSLSPLNLLGMLQSYI